MRESVGDSMRIGIMLLTGPYQCESSDTVVHVVEAFLRKDHIVEGIFLFMDGVYNMNKHVNPSGERNIVELMDRLGEKVPITACSACAQFRGMKKEFSSTNINLGGLGDLVRLMQKCDRFLVFGG
ncbi:MAG: DsrE family protein [Theionarchaea archaeon]|nr:DsrE family protein [Theionarchaea archaeon]